MKHYINQTIITLLILLCSSATFAQDKKIAMLKPIKNSIGIKDMVSDMVRGELINALTRKPGYSAFSRNDLDKVLEEYKFQESGMVDETQRRKIGQMTGADYVCISKISKDGDSYYIQAFLVNIESGQISDPGTDFAQGGLPSVNQACKNVASRMVGKNVVNNNKKINGANDNENQPPTNKKTVLHNKQLEITIVGINKKGNTLEIVYKQKNVGNKPIYISNLYPFKARSGDGDLFDDDITKNFTDHLVPGAVRKATAYIQNVPNSVKITQINIGTHFGFTRTSTHYNHKVHTINIYN